MVPDELCQFTNPNMYMYSLYADLAERREDTVTPYMIVNLSSTENLYLPKKNVIAFEEERWHRGQDLWNRQSRYVTMKLGTQANTAIIHPVHPYWDRNRPTQGFEQTASNFIKSPPEVETHRKVDLKDAPNKEETKGKFSELCDWFDSIISKGSDDIGKTLLVEKGI